jgi:hypothetical protein
MPEKRPSHDPTVELPPSPESRRPSPRSFCEILAERAQVTHDLIETSQEAQLRVLETTITDLNLIEIHKQEGKAMGGSHELLRRAQCISAVLPLF